jgi:hypothetical protein
MSESIISKHIDYRNRIFIFRCCFILIMKINTYPIAGVLLLHGYNVGNTLHISARSNESYVK